MTATERAKRSDALYYETVSVNRRVLCDMVANREAENDKLQNDADLLRAMLSQERTEKRCYMSENATLRTQLADVTESMGRVEERCAKLRELVRDVWHLFAEHGAVNPCDLPVVDAVRDRMRDLGVEVDE